MILLIGASGQLGSSLKKEWENLGIKVFAPSHQELDFLNEIDLDLYIEKVSPKVLVNCSAFHDVNACEKNPEIAFRNNTTAIYFASRICEKRDIEFATISTDYIFDGKINRPYNESDLPNPLNEYGRSKLAGELLIQGTKKYIIRTSGVFGETGISNKGYTFIERILRQAEKDQAIQVVDNIIFSPSYTPHISKVIVDIIDKKLFGTHHVTNNGSTNWYEFAKTALEIAQIQANIQPIQYKPKEEEVKRPLYSALESITLPVAKIVSAPYWSKALEDYIIARSNRKNHSN